MEARWPREGQEADVEDDVDVDVVVEAVEPSFFVADASAFLADESPDPAVDDPPEDESDLRESVR